MAADPKEIIKRHGKLYAAYANHADQHERMAPYIAPSRVGITGGSAPGDKQTRGVYDSTSMMAAELNAHFIAGNVINPGQIWLGYAMRRDQDRIIDPIGEWLEECRDLTLRRSASSPFYAEGAEALIDWVGFGTGCIIGEESPQPVNRTVRGFRGFMWEAVKTGRFYVAEGADGQVDTLHREWEPTARAIADRWFDGKPSDRMPEDIKQALARGEQDRTFKVIHAIYPRPKAQQHGGGGDGMAWASCWVSKDSASLIYESGYRTFPAAIPRYHRTPGDGGYGRGRGALAFPDTWSLNSAKRMGFEDWALKIRPPILHGHNTVIGTLKLVPGGPTSVNLHGKPMRDQIMAFESGGRPEVSQIKEEELRASIQRIFYVDQILKLLEVEKSEMTAYEFHKKLELLFRIMGPVYGRAEWEFLYAVGNIMWDIQSAARAFPPPPPEVYQTDGNIDIEFQNPLSKAQRSGDAEAITLALGDGAGLIQMFGPQVLDRLDPEKAMDMILDTRGVPKRVQRNDKEMKALRDARAAENQKTQALDDTSQISESIGKAGPGIKAAKDAGIDVTKAMGNGMGPGNAPVR